MNGLQSTRARRVEVSDPIVRQQRFDYTDAFSADRSAPLVQPRSWVGSGLVHVPGWVDVVARLLGMDDSSESADPLAGWRIREETEELIHLEYDLPMMDVTVVGRNVPPSTVMLSTGLHYRRRLLARIAWAVIGPGHRFMSRRLVAGRLDSEQIRAHHAGPIAPA